MTDWLTPQQFATAAGCHVVTVWRELERGELHGHQRRKGGRWQIHPGAVDARRRGLDTAEPCGCSRVTPLRRRNAA